MTDTDRWPELAASFGINAAPPPAYSGYKLAYRTASDHNPMASLLRPRGDGERTLSLTRLAGHLLRMGHSLQETTALCLLWNETNDPPLPEEKVVATCDSIARSDLRNHPERHTAANDACFEPWFDPESARVAAFLTKPPPERDWLVKGLLPKGIVGMVSAPGGSSKSQLLMQLAYAVAQGGSFLGRWAIGRPGSALMLCAEDEEQEIHRRLYRLHQQSGGLDTGVIERLFIRSTVGERTLLTEASPTGEVDMTGLVHRLAATAKRIPDLQLIVIDPASRFRGGEENSNEDATRFIEALEFLAKETGATVLLAHHSNKAALNSVEATQNSARGASALTDGARWHLALSRPPKNHWIVKLAGDEARATHVELSLVKTNYTAPMEPVLLRRDGGGQLSCATTEYTATEAVLPQLGMLVQAVKDSPGITRRQMEQQHFGVDKPIGLSEKAGRAMVQTAVQWGYLDGDTRGPLSVTAKGLELLGRTVPQSAAGAARRGSPPRKKSTQSTT